MSRITVWLACACSILIGAHWCEAQVPDRDQEIVHSYKMTIASKLTMDADGKKQKVNADSEIRYTWKQKGNKRTLFLNEIKIELKIDGAEIMNSTMNREKFRFKGQEKENVGFSCESAPEQMKKMLKDSFGAPICWLEVDKNGREVKRTIFAGPGAKATIEQGMIANTLLCHPQIFHDKH